MTANDAWSRDYWDKGFRLFASGRRCASAAGRAQAGHADAAWTCTGRGEKNISKEEVSSTGSAHAGWSREHHDGAGEVPGRHHPRQPQARWQADLRRGALGALDDPRIEWEFLPQLEAELTPETAAKYDAAAVMLAKITRKTVSGPNRRLKLIARFGVGYDTVDVPALTDNGVHPHHHAGRRAPPGGELRAHLHSDARASGDDQGSAGARGPLGRAHRIIWAPGCPVACSVPSAWATSARSCSAWPCRSPCATWPAIPMSRRNPWRRWA